MNNFKKVIRIGMVDVGNVLASLFCKIEYTDGRLSISGVEGPLSNGDAKGSCGQIDMHEWKFLNYADGWNAALVKQFRAVWSKWHLNDMKAGSKVQEDYLENNPVPKEAYAFPKSQYVVVGDVLAAAGLNPDPDGYKYGHAWKRQEVPEDVIE